VSKKADKHTKRQRRMLLASKILSSDQARRTYEACRRWRCNANKPAWWSLRMRSLASLNLCRTEMEKKVKRKNNNNQHTKVDRMKRR